jgi:hypothetical protein
MSHDSLYVYAARYARNRNTGAALQVVNQILAAWDELDEQTKAQLQREAREAQYNHDDWARLINHQEG